MEAIKELLEWQKLQQEKLHQYQLEQKERLRKEHQRIYETFGILNNDEDGYVIDVTEDLDNEAYVEQKETSYLEDLIIPEPLNSYKHHSEENIHSSGKDTRFPERNVSVHDELPVGPAADDFNTLLSERLNGEEKPKLVQPNNGKPKRKFLRKGEGLARFRMKPDDIRKRAKQSSRRQIQQTSNKQPKPNNEIEKSASNRQKSFTKSENKQYALGKLVQDDMRPDCSNTKNIKDSRNHDREPMGTWTQVLQHGDESHKAQINQEVCKNQNLPNNSIYEILKNADQRKEKELEELRMFELLEQQAGNSSFCSTSSWVTKFMNSSVVSTPIKNYPTALKNNNCATSECQHPVDEKTIQANNSYKNFKKGTVMSSNTCFNDKTDNHDSNYFWPDLRKYNIEKETKTFEECPHVTIPQSKDNACENFRPQHKPDEIQQIAKPATNKVSNDDSVHVRFSDTNEYKSISCYSSEGDTLNETSQCFDRSMISDDADGTSKLNLVFNKKFRDDEEWSDNCSCESCVTSDCDTCHAGNQDASELLQHDSGSIHTGEHEDVEALRDITNNSSDQDIYRNPILANKTQGNLQEQSKASFKENSNQVHIAKDAILKNRLEELEKEITIFRKENSNFSSLRKQYEEELIRFRKEKRELEKKLREDKEQFEKTLMEERKKFSKERQVFEMYIKDVKNKSSRQEREEIENLKKQVSHLQEEIHKKDSRWSAMQIRTRDRLRQLEREITRLKEENDNLIKNAHAAKKVRFSAAEKRSTNTKIMHAINNQIGKIKPKDLENTIVIHNVVPKRNIPASVLSQGDKSKSKKDVKEKQSNSKPKLKTYADIPQLVEKSDNVTDLKHKEEHLFDMYVPEDLENESEDIHPKEDAEEEKMRQLIYDAFYGSENMEHPTVQKSETDPIAEKSSTLDKTGNDKLNSRTHVECITLSDDDDDDDDDDSDGKVNLNNYEENSSNKHGTSLVDLTEINENDSDIVLHCVPNDLPKRLIEDKTPSLREKLHPDGRKEIWYPNGNVKKISADGSVEKMIYYNGDVKEKSLKDDIETYYYAETKTWQTTYSDGTELYEFSNGQTEKHRPNGSLEIKFPNGCVKITYPDGHEEWALPCGTLVKVEANGIKTICFSNGQKEIHTKEHKRREYPDGTVKYVYPDGMQETRYASGRIRMKDKDGKIIMDTEYS